MMPSSTPDRLDDVRQLAGLCDLMDKDAFLPLRSEELTSVDQPRRFLQLAQLAIDIGNALVDAGAAATKNATGSKLTAASGLGIHGRYLQANGVTFLLALDCTYWAAHRFSPLWIRIDAQQFPAAATRLRREAEAALDCEVVADRAQWLSVPLPVASGVERPEIIIKAVDFCLRVFDLFRDAALNSVYVSATQPIQVRIN